MSNEIEFDPPEIDLTTLPAPTISPALANLANPSVPVSAATQFVEGAADSIDNLVPDEASVDQEAEASPFAAPTSDWSAPPVIDPEPVSSLFGNRDDVSTDSESEYEPDIAGHTVSSAGREAGVTTQGEFARAPRRINYQADPALVIRNLHKSFGAKHAVNDLSLTVPAGCLFGIVGPNGAGKTTTLSIVTGLLRPDHGSVSVWGNDVWSDPARAKATMGVLPDGLRLFDRLSGRELLAFCGDMRSMDPAVTSERSQELLDTLGLTNDADTLVADYSAGMTKKIGLAAALIHRPRLLILDEPFEAVDPVSGQAIRSILNDFVDGGGTVVLSSHVMELVESLCDAVAVISEGQVLTAGEIAEVKQGVPLQQRFMHLVGAEVSEGGHLKWLRRSSDSSSS